MVTVFSEFQSEGLKVSWDGETVPTLESLTVTGMLTDDEGAKPRFTVKRPFLRIPSLVLQDLQ